MALRIKANQKDGELGSLKCPDLFPLPVAPRRGSLPQGPGSPTVLVERARSESPVGWARRSGLRAAPEPASLVSAVCLDKPLAEPPSCLLPSPSLLVETLPMFEDPPPPRTMRPLPDGLRFNPLSLPVCPIIISSLATFYLELWLLIYLPPFQRDSLSCNYMGGPELVTGDEKDTVSVP